MFEYFYNEVFRSVIIGFGSLFNGIEIKKFRKNFVSNLIDLLSEAETGLYKSDDCFPLVSMMLNYLERNYIKDIHLGDSSKKLGEIINKLLEYSQSFSQRQ